MEISLFQEDEPLRLERIVLYPYPELKRIWTRAWMTAAQDQTPNIEIAVYNPDGTENNSVYLMAHPEPRVDTTLHMRDPQPGATYLVVAELSVGAFDKPEVLDRQEFIMTLEFRNPDDKEAGFGMGVDWDELKKYG